MSSYLPKCNLTNYLNFYIALQKYMFNANMNTLFVHTELLCFICDITLHIAYMTHN